MTFFPLTRSIEPAKTPPKGIAVQALARTSAQSWGETDRAALRRGEVQVRRQGQARARCPWPRSPRSRSQQGPAPAGKAEGAGKGDATGKAEAGKGDGAEPKPARARIVVVGTANLASNQFLGAQGNRDFFLNVDVLARRGGETSSRSAPGGHGGADRPVGRRSRSWCSGCRSSCCRGVVVLRDRRRGAAAAARAERFPHDRWKTFAALVVLLAGFGGFYVLRHLLALARPREDGDRKGRLWDVEAEGRRGRHHQAQGRDGAPQARPNRLGDARAGEGARRPRRRGRLVTSLATVRVDREMRRSPPQARRLRPQGA